MKLTIQGHPTRGKEIIQILESLGGKNTSNHNGKDNYAYYISSIDNRIYKTSLLFSGYKHYTLEEFEKEFPFKVGDKVTVMTNAIYKVVALEYYMSELSYKLDNGLHYSSELLTLYKEVKEERNITLTLDKAKEWYKKGGELKEVALQAYSEKELTKVDLPKTWEEFCKNYPVKETEAVICCDSTIVNCNGFGKKRDSEVYKDVCPSKKSAEAHLALIQLEQLRNCWWNGWAPIWDCSEKWCIGLWGNELSIGTITNASKFLTFPTREMAKEFLECFKDLIEKARNLI